MDSSTDISKVIERLRFSSRPVMFRTGVPDALYAIAGTAFLVGFGRHVYLVTAAHVAKGEEAIRSLFVFPSDDAIAPLRFTQWWPVKAFDCDELDQEGSDISAIRIDLRRIHQIDRKNSHLILLNSPKEWFSGRFASTFFLCGYPKMANSVDYLRQTISTAQFFLQGRYVRRDRYSSFTHELTVENLQNLGSFDGLSGSPVFSLAPLSEDPTPRFCGMVLRGSAQSRTVHFLEAQAIVTVMEEVEKN